MFDRLMSSGALTLPSSTHSPRPLCVFSSAQAVGVNSLPLFFLLLLLLSLNAVFSVSTRAPLPRPPTPRSIRVVFVSDRSSEREKGTRGEGNQTAPSIRTAHSHTRTHTHTHRHRGARLYSTPSSSLVALFILSVADTFVRQLKTRRSHCFFLFREGGMCV